MKSLNNNIHTALGIAQDKNVCILALGTEATSKTKLHSTPQSNHNWKPINAFAISLGIQMEVKHSICAQFCSKHQYLCMENWDVTSLNGKEQELVWEAEQYHLDIVGVSLTKCHGSDTVELNESWKLFNSGVDVTMSAQARVSIFVSPQLTHCVIDCIPTWRKGLSS